MGTTRITDRQARDAVDLAFDPDISMTRKEEDMAAEVAEIDALLDEFDRELRTAARTARSSRKRRPFADVERARRSQRRAVRDVLSLTHANALLAGLSRQGKNAPVLDSDEFGEVA